MENDTKPYRKISMEIVRSLNAENIVNLIIKMANMEIEQKQCGKGYFLWRLYGKISMEVVWSFDAENKANLIIKMVSMEIVRKQCGK